MREQRLRIKAFLAGSEVHLAPSCADAFSAAAIERLGFKALHLSGHSMHKSLCLPDAGLVTAAEFESRIVSIVEAVQLPLVVDGETGFGGVRNVRRTVRTFERAGASAIHFEDQVTPRRFRTSGLSPTISIDEMVAKLKAALDARRDANLAIIARCEERSSDGALVERLVAYAEAGVDALWSSGFSADLIRQVQDRARAIPFIGIAGDLRSAATRSLRIGVYPTLAIVAAAWGMTTVLARLRDGVPPDEVFGGLDGAEEIRVWFRNLGEANYAD